MSILSPLVLSLFFACGEDEAVVEEAPQTVAEPAQPKEKTSQDVLKEFKVQLGQGKIAKAKESLTKLNVDDESGAFHLAGGIAWSGADASLAEQHGDWARLIAGDAQGAYDASTSGGMKALAVARGAKSALIGEWTASKSNSRSKKTEDERIWTSVESLELLIASGDVTHLDSAKAVTEWSGQIALAEWAHANNKMDVATEAFANAAAIEGLGQLYAAALNAGHSKDVESLKDVIGKASGIGDVVAGMTAIDALINTHLEKGSMSALWNDTYEALKGEHKSKLSDASWEMLALTRVGVLTGHTGDVLEISLKLIDQTEGTVLSDSMFYAGIIGMRLTDDGLLKSVEAKEGGSSLIGLLSTGVGLADLSIEQQYLVATTVSSRSAEFSSSHLNKVLKLDLPTAHRVQLELIQMDWMRHQGQNTDAILDSMVAAHSDKPNLQMELMARKSLTNFAAPVSVPSVEGASALEMAWAQIGAGKADKIAATDRNSKALVAWMNLLNADRTGKPIDTSLDELWQNAPLHRVGALSTHTALDLSDGADFVGMFRRIVGRTGDAQTMSAVGLLELARTVQQRNDEGFAGRSVISALSVEERRPLMVALEGVRSGMLEFWMGESFPVDAFTALSKAEKDIMNNPKNTHLYNQTVISGRGIREQMNTISSVISVVENNGQYLAGVVSPNASDAVVLGSVKSIDKLVQKHHAALIAGLSDTKINHLPGNDLRAAVLQPLSSALTGVGKYLVIVPPAMAKFGFSTLPEQKEGLRFFANTPRDITLSTSLDAMWSANQVYSDYEIDMLAFGRSTEAETWIPSVTDTDKSALLTNQGFSPEIGLIKVHFSDSSNVFIREEATLEAFAEKAPRSRYIYLSEIPATADGGFEMANGVLTLDAITGLDLHAMVVFIGPDSDSTRQAKRVEAFMQAGAQAVIVQSWAIPANDLRVIVENMFMNLKRNDPLLVAMKKTRSKYIGDKSKDVYENNPAMWGAFTVFSRP